MAAYLILVGVRGNYTFPHATFKKVATVFIAFTNNPSINFILHYVENAIKRTAVLILIANCYILIKIIYTYIHPVGSVEKSAFKMNLHCILNLNI